MASLQQLETALRNADAAGDVEAAKKLAGAITAARQGAPASPAPDMSSKEWLDDQANSIGSGLALGAVAVPGTPGTIRDLGRAATNKLFPNAEANRKKYQAVDMFGWLPNVEDTTPEGLNYEPKTTSGQYLQTGGEMAFNALAPGGLLRKGAMVAGPALATETAGRAARTLAPEYEPQVRAATAILSTVLAGKSKGIKEMSTAELKAVKDKAYAVADANGETIAPEVFDEILNRVGAAAYEAGARPGLADRSINALKYADEYSGQALPISELDKVRQLLKSAGANRLEGTDVNVSGRMVSEFDNALNEKAINAHADARKANTAYKRSEFVDDLNHKIDLKTSKFSLSGRENATRDVYRQLAGNENKTRYMDKATKDAIDRVAMGGKVENAARWGGKFAPTGPIPAGAAILSGDAATAAGIMGPGIVSRLVATALTSKNRRLAEALIKRGGEEGKNAFAQAQEKLQRDALVRALLGGQSASGVAGR